MSEEGEALAELESNPGIARLRPAQFEPALLGLISTWLDPGRRIPAIAPSPHGRANTILKGDSDQ